MIKSEPSLVGLQSWDSWKSGIKNGMGASSGPLESGFLAVEMI